MQETITVIRLIASITGGGAAACQSIMLWDKTQLKFSVEKAP